MGSWRARAASTALGALRGNATRTTAHVVQPPLASFATLAAASRCLERPIHHSPSLAAAAAVQYRAWGHHLEPAAPVHRPQWTRVLSTSTAAWQRQDETTDVEDDPDETVESLLQELEESSDDEGWLSESSDDEAFLVDSEDEDEDMRESQSESDSKPESDLDEEEAPFSKHMRAFMKLQASMQAQFERGVRAKMEATGEKRSKVIMNMDMLDTPLTPQQEAEQAELARLLRLAQLEAQLQADGGEPSDEELYRLLEEEQAEAEAAVPSPEQIKAFRKLEASLQAQFQREVQTNMQATGEKRSKVIMDMLGTPLTPQQEAQQEAEVAQLFRQALREVHLEASGVEPSDEELDRLVEEAQAKAEELDRLVEEAQAKAEELDRLVEEAQTKAKAADSADQQEAFEAFRQAVREMHLEASGVDPSDKELENQVEELVEWKELVELKELVEQASRKAELAAELEGHDEDAEELANMSAEEIEALAEEAREQFRNAMLEAVEEATDEWLLIKDQQRGEEAKARRAARREAGEEGHKLVSVNMGEVADVHEGAEGAEDGLMDHSSDEEYSDYEELTEEEEQEEGYPLHCNGPHHTTEVPMNNLDVAAKRLSRTLWTDGLKDSDRKPYHLRKAVQKVLDKEDLFRKHAKRKVKRKIKWLEERRNKGF